MKIYRKDFLKLVGMSSTAVLLGKFGLEAALKNKNDQPDFFFVQVSDTHWGFTGPKINPDSTGTLKKAIAAINSMEKKPDFIVFTGDLTHTTDDPKERRKRLAEVRDIIKGLKVKNIKFLAGEHDAALDNGKAYKEFFGKTYYTFVHKGIHFIAIDNVSDPTSSIGEVQLKWLRGVLKKLNKKARIIVLTHRPLYDLYPQWDWWTRDGAKAIELLKPFKNVAVLYGHIHQEIHDTSSAIAHHAVKGMMFPLPAPGSVPKKAPIPWDPEKPYNGLGYRGIRVSMSTPELMLTEFPIVASNETTAQVIKITAKKFEYSPSEITLKKGVPVVLEFTSLDVAHGFNCPDLGVRTDIIPGKASRVNLVPQKAGTFNFICDIFCGDGHEGMSGKIIVEE